MNKGNFHSTGAEFAVITSAEWSRQAKKISTATPWTLNGSIYNRINDTQLAPWEILWKTSPLPLPFERVGETFPLLIPNLWALGRFYDRKGDTINFSSQEQSTNPRALNTTLVFANVPTGAVAVQSSFLCRCCVKWEAPFWDGTIIKQAICSALLLLKDLCPSMTCSAFEMHLDNALRA